MIKRNIANLEEIEAILPKSLRVSCGQALSDAYSIELKRLEDYAQGMEEGEIYLGKPELFGAQWICDFSVSDFGKQYNPDSFNWHLQNTSQWRYAGCIAVSNDTGEVSRHH